MFLGRLIFLILFAVVASELVGNVTQGQHLRGNKFPLDTRAPVNTTKDQICYRGSVAREVPCVRNARERLRFAFANASSVIIFH